MADMAYGINNITLTLADTEYAVDMPPGYRGASLQARTSADFRLAYAAGKVAGPTAPYATVKADSVFTVESRSGSVIYLASADAGTVVEMEVF